MSVDVSGSARRRGLRRRDLARRAQRLLDALDRSADELSVALVSDDEIHALNAEYRGKDRPTDVLSFPLLEGESVIDEGGAIGDVVISLDTALRQAEERGASLAEEVDRLLVHGLLHLLGYDHEISAAEARRMQRKERSLLAGLPG